MHPIEQLRYVARASGADATMLAQEAASALSVFSDDPHALLTGAKSLLSRQPSVGALWWMCSHLVADANTRAAARRVIEELRDDDTPDEVAGALKAGSTVLIGGWPDLTLRGLLQRPDVSVLILDVEGQGHAAVRRLERAGVDAEAVDPAHVAGAVEDADLVVVEAGAVGERMALTDVGGLTMAAVARTCATPAWLVAGVGRRVSEAYWQEIVQRLDEPDLPRFVDGHEVVSVDFFARSFGPPSDCPTLPELLRPVR